MSGISSHIKSLQSATAALRQQLIDHEVYRAINSLDELKIFMEHHVFAVWDFMSLLKSLQRELTCVAVPWVPKGTGTTRYLINEIVTGEESDEDEHGNRMSHFELYLVAMEEVGCNTLPIKSFLEQVQQGKSVAEALRISQAPAGAARFVTHTFDVIANGTVHEQAAVFTFGREDLIPGMFIELVRELAARFPDKMNTFKYYLERHIEVDGDHHSLLAYQMTDELCGGAAANWEQATVAVKAALEARIALWNSIGQLTAAVAS